MPTFHHTRNLDLRAQAGSSAAPIIRRLVTSPTTPENLAATTGFPLTSVHDALDNLASEGLVEANGNQFRLPE